MNFLKILLFTLAYAAIASGCAGPDSLIQVHAYPSPKLEPSSLATVYGVWNGAGGEQTYICSVDGRSYARMGAISNCPSVVYLPAGEHRLTIKYIYANYYADKEFPVNVSAGKTYQVTSTSADLKKALFGVTEKPESFQLKYKDLVPVLKEKFKEKGEDLVLSRNAD